MKKILVVTITYDRLDLFKQCYGSMKYTNKDFEGDIQYVVIDNGSKKEMKSYLSQLKGVKVFFNETNEGITAAWFKVFNWAKENYDFDYLIKYDPDVNVLTPNILNLALNLWRNNGDRYIFAPIDKRIKKSYQPRAIAPTRPIKAGALQIEFTPTTHVGGACSFYPKKAMDLLFSKTPTPKGDMKRGEFFRKNYFEVGYLNGIFMAHLGVDKSTPDKKYKF